MIDDELKFMLPYTWDMTPESIWYCVICEKDQIYKDSVPYHIDADYQYRNTKFYNAYKDWDGFMRGAIFSMMRTCACRDCLKKIYEDFGCVPYQGPTYAEVFPDAGKIFLVHNGEVERHEP